MKGKRQLQNHNELIYRSIISGCEVFCYPDANIVSLYETLYPSIVKITIQANCKKHILPTHQASLNDSQNN